MYIYSRDIVNLITESRRVSLYHKGQTLAFRVQGRAEALMVLNEIVKNASWTFLINVLPRDEIEDDESKEVSRSGERSGEWWYRGRSRSKRRIRKEAFINVGVPSKI